MQSIYEKAFVFVSCLGKFLDVFKIFSRIKISPLTVVVWIILWCEHILVHLDLAAKLHQIDTVFQ